MQAVVRLLSGQEERTMAEKLADPNRPTWEQYKKDNSDKLNLEGVDQKKMEEYRAQLDREREDRLARGTNHKKDSKKKKKKSYDSDSSEEDRKRKRKKRKKKKHRRRDDDDSSSSDSESSASDESRRKHKRKRHKKKKKKADGGGEDSDGSHYRLSKFFDGDE